MTVKEFFLNLLNKHSSLSSKRFLGYYCLGLLTLAFIGMTFGLAVPEVIVNILEQLIISALIATTVDHFGKNDNKTENTNLNEGPSNS